MDSTGEKPEPSARLTEAIAGGAAAADVGGGGRSGWTTTTIDDLPITALCCVFGFVDIEPVGQGGATGLYGIPLVCRWWKTVCQKHVLVEAPQLFKRGNFAKVCVWNACLGRFRGVRDVSLNLLAGKGVHFSNIDSVTLKAAETRELVGEAAHVVEARTLQCIQKLLLCPVFNRLAITSHSDFSEALRGKCNQLSALAMYCLHTCERGPGADNKGTDSDDEQSAEEESDYDPGQDEGRTEVEGLSLPDNEGLAAVLQGCSKLRVLKVAGCWGSDVFTGAGLKGCPNLIELNLENNFAAMNDATLETVVRQCSNIRSIHIGMAEYASDNFTNAGLQAVAKYGRELRVLQLEGYIDGMNWENGVVPVLRGCHNLVWFSYGGYRQHIVELTSAQDGQRSHPGESLLKHLFLGNKGELNPKTGLAFLAQFCQHLEDLDVHYLGATDEDLQALAGGCPHLRTIQVGADGQGVTDTGVCALVEACQHLVMLNIHQAFSGSTDMLQRVTNRSLQAVGAHANLKEFYCDSWGITDVGLFNFAAESASLSAITLTHCPLVSMAGILSLLNKCRELTELTAYGLQKTPDSELAEWQGVLAPEFPHVTLNLR